MSSCANPPIPATPNLPICVRAIHSFATQNLPAIPATPSSKGIYHHTKITPSSGNLRTQRSPPIPPLRRLPASGKHPWLAGLRLFNCDTLKFPRVPARVSEALVLRTYPLKEADLVVSFLTRDQGKLRGVAKRARRPKSTFGSGLERLSHVRMAYFQRESHELVNLDSCELIRSQFDLVTDYQAQYRAGLLRGSERAVVALRGAEREVFSPARGRAGVASAGGGGQCASG